MKTENKKKRIRTLASFCVALALILTCVRPVAAAEDQDADYGYTPWLGDQFCTGFETDYYYAILSEDDVTDQIQFLYDPSTQNGFAYAGTERYGTNSAFACTKDGAGIFSYQYAGKDGETGYGVACFDGKEVETIYDFGTEYDVMDMLFPTLNGDGCFALTSKIGEDGESYTATLFVIAFETKQAVEVFSNEYGTESLFGLMTAPSGGTVWISEIGLGESGDGIRIRMYQEPGVAVDRYVDEEASSDDALAIIYADDDGNLLLRAEYTEEAYVLKSDGEEPVDLGITYEGVQTTRGCDEFLFSTEEGIFCYTFDMEKPELLLEDEQYAFLITPDAMAYDDTNVRIYDADAYTTMRYGAESFDGLCFYAEGDESCAIYKINSLEDQDVVKVCDLQNPNYFSINSSSGRRVYSDTLAVSDDLATMVALDEQTIHVIDMETAKEKTYEVGLEYDAMYLNKELTKALFVSVDGKDGETVDLTDGSIEAFSICSEPEDDEYITKVSNEAFEGIVMIADGGILFAGYDGKTETAELSDEVKGYLEDLESYESAYIRGQTVLKMETESDEAVHFLAVTEENEVIEVFRYADEDGPIEIG